MAAFGVCAVDQQAANARLPHFVEGDFLMAIKAPALSSSFVSF
jgi:hypothetical protein